MLSLPAVAADLVVLYPEEIFPALRPLLETALERAPALRAYAETVSERSGQALAENSRRNSSLFLHGRVMGGYEQRSEDFNTSDGPRSGRPVATLDASLWWQKPLYAWGNLDRFARIGELGVEAAELDRADATRSHLNQIRSTFLTWQLAERQRQVLDENLQLSARLVDNQRKLLEAGRVSEAQLLELEASLRETEERRAALDRDREYFRNRLAVLVGDEALVEAIGIVDLPDFSLPLEAGPEGWEETVNAAVAEHPAIEREQRYARIDAVRAEVSAQNQKPTLDFVTGLVSGRLDSADADNSAFRVVGYVGLQVRWNIFDGRRSEGEQMAALARQRGREARLEAAVAQIRDEGARLVANLKLHDAQIASRTQRAALLARQLELAADPAGGNRVAPVEELRLRLNYLLLEQRVLEAKADFLLTMTQLAALAFIDPVAGR